MAKENATVIGIVAAETSKKFECNMNRYIKREGKAKIPVKGFGSSDCKENCESHLLFFPDIIRDELAQKVIKCARLVNSKVYVVRL